MGQTYKSLYKPENPSKYKGNPNNIICRSSWERKFCRYCDLNEKIVQWGSEEFHIPYVSPVDGRVHRYFPDFIIKVKEQHEYKVYVVEVKPLKQTAPPKKRARVTQSYISEAKTYAVNQAKWKAAEEFCADRCIEFKIITEKELGIK